MSLNWNKLAAGTLQVLFLLLVGPKITVNAQDDNPLQQCTSSSSVDLDLEQFSGIWWEVARQPAASMFCTQINITAVGNDEVDIVTWYSNTATYPWVNQSMTLTNFSMQDTIPNTGGYNLSFVAPPTVTPYTAFKILATDYTNYTLICGYTNATDSTTAFAMILTRDRTPSTDALTALETQGSTFNSNFGSSMTLVTQDDTCYDNHSNRNTFSVLYIFVMCLITCLLNN
ncbi:uncharacterized protein LOC115623506 isoform X1 [Scaptodrosophila lebanonensis]|uniref:Uncharacterized protein LOC115623506 isoform X1 n=1 Tax=Drosophila lebanonensis TaxID=7225 RepID=A0A6J2TEB7_DROLE|nr:uncharacterized protein LOC115623506 isoform X1 [Scaptodrosophila lebanonensis]XP_030373745.1 uncharacterized protein LOC115623506 isoform X1 [Scaptodrosophila lebanonensis]